MSRSLPNIIITGTSGCGKTSHAKEIAEKISTLRHFAISEFAFKEGCIDSYDEGRDTSVVDEDKLLDLLEPEMEKGGCLIDWHVCDVFPERLIDLVVVLRCDNKQLYQRMSQRGYKQSKIDENLDVEIMEVILESAKESYAPEIVIELRSENDQLLAENVSRIVGWAENWISDHPDGVSNALLEGSEDESESESGSED